MEPNSRPAQGADRQRSVGSSSDFVGHAVVDEHDQRIGTVVDVAYDDAPRGAGSPSESPSWLVVDPGRFRAPHWVPVAGSYRSSAGSIVVPWDRELVKHAPKATDDHLMTPTLERQLAAHYELTH